MAGFLNSDAGDYLKDNVEILLGMLDLFCNSGGCLGYFSFEDPREMHGSAHVLSWPYQPCYAAGLQYDTYDMQCLSRNVVFYVKSC